MTTIASAPIPAASRAPDPRPFHGTWATVLLPIDENDQIAREKLNGQLKHLVSSGIQGIYTNGTAGEFEMQTEGEFDWLTECACALFEQVDESLGSVQLVYALAYGP